MSADRLYGEIKNSNKNNLIKNIEEFSKDKEFA